jgi:hypothetical protein
MSTLQLRQRVKEKIDGLTPARLRSAEQLIDLLTADKANRATLELLQIPGLAQDVENGLRDIRAGKGIALAKLRRKY